MKVRLLEEAHKFYAIEGTEGKLENVDGNYRFQPDGADFKLWIGRVKWEAITEEPKADVKPTRSRR